MVGLLLVDLSAAFDMVDHSILLKKLELYGMDYQSISWMNSYLSRRSQVVMVDGCLSPSLPITCGVPQVSILGPLLYIDSQEKCYQECMEIKKYVDTKCNYADLFYNPSKKLAQELKSIMKMREGLIE